MESVQHRAFVFSAVCSHAWVSVPVTDSFVWNQDFHFPSFNSAFNRRLHMWTVFLLWSRC